MEATLYSELPPNECARILSDEIINGPILLPVFTKKTAVLGTVWKTQDSQHKFRLIKNAVLRHNLFKRCLNGEIESDGTGSRIKLKSGIRPIVYWILSFWIIAALYFVSKYYLREFQNGTFLLDSLANTSMMIAGFFLILFTVNYLFGRLLGIGDIDFLKSFVATKLNADRS